MQRSAEQIVLVCDKCREKLILLGAEEEWRSRRAVFQCECGQRLTIDGQANEEVPAAS
jgi:hypothetical protein